MEYLKMPADRQEAVLRAEVLKDFLEKEVGGTWEIRVHENLGWFYSCSCGTINVSENSKDYGNGGYLILNGVNGVGYGYSNMNSFHPKERGELKMFIEQSLIQQRTMLNNHNAWYKKNAEMLGFIELEK